MLLMQYVLEGKASLFQDFSFSGEIQRFLYFRNIVIGELFVWVKPMGTQSKVPEPSSSKLPGNAL